MVKRSNYIVYAPNFNANSGGSIFLHELVNALNKLGEAAFIWPWRRLPASGYRAKIMSQLRLPGSGWARSIKTNPNLCTPVATLEDFTNSTIVVYPEVTLGNPMQAQNVVRWLLYKPGLRHPYKFGNSDMFFTAGSFCDIPEITGGAPELLMWRRNPVYQNYNFADRSGACYIVRKGAYKNRIPETANAIQIDGLSHEEISQTFNRCETFYSYDEATLYSQYAAICGCRSVVIPGLYNSREEWSENHKLGRFGIAYGTEDHELKHADATRHLVLGLLQEQEAIGRKTVENFVKLTHERFG